MLRKNLNGFLSSKQPYGIDTPYPQMAKQTEAKRGSDLPKVPRLVSETEFVPVTPELMVFLPVLLHSFPDKWTFSCLDSKWEENDTYCSSALRANHSESVTKGGCEGGVCTAGWSFQRPPPLGTSTLLAALYCFSLMSFSAIALSIARFRKNMFALHSLPLSVCSPKLFSPLSFSFLQNTVFQPLKFLAAFQTFSYLLLIPQDAWGWFLRQPEAITSVLICHH